MADRSTSETVARRPHAVLDIPSRRLKALKIEQLLRLEQHPGPMRLLEVGTGSGGIAQYFASHPSGRYEVDAVDVVDSRLATSGYRFRLVSGTSLPFEDGSFDVVLSNHVIEHVGHLSDQRNHLAELRRVLKGTGVGYLAVPNRWMLVEPHYRLAFLSWLPRRLRTPYLRMAGRGNHYDCEPLELAEIENMFAECRLGSKNLCIEALRATLRIERQDSAMGRLLAHVPDAALSPLRGLIPTLIYRFWRQDP